MILWVLLIVALLIIVAIVIDLGNARQEKRQLQNAADAAALAGASDLGTPTAADACPTAYGYAFNNLRLGAAPAACAAIHSAGNVSVRVKTPYTGGPTAFSPETKLNVAICKDVPTSFARIITISSVRVCGNATARKIITPNAGAGEGGTTTLDPDAPCTVDAFTTDGYFDAKNPTNGFPPKTVADAAHSGGPPGGPSGEDKVMGATYWSTTDIDRTTRPPSFSLRNNTSGSTTTFTYAGDDNPVGFYITRMVKVDNALVPADIFAYDVVWRVPKGLPNNANYTVALTVYDSASANYPPDGKCGKSQWQFTKGTPPPSGSTPCGEDAFLGTIKPAPGAVVRPGDIVTASYQDESFLYNPTDPLDPNRLQFTIDGNPIPQAALGTPVPQGPNTIVEPGGSTTEYTLKSPSASPTKEKYSTDIQYKLPSSLSNGPHTIFLKSYDSDNNKPGGDCGVATWTINLTGGASNVVLVE